MSSDRGLPATSESPGAVWSPWNVGTCTSGCTLRSRGFRERRRTCQAPNDCHGAAYDVMLCDDIKVSILIINSVNLNINFKILMNYHKMKRLHQQSSLFNCFHLLNNFYGNFIHNNVDNKRAKYKRTNLLSYVGNVPIKEKIIKLRTKPCAFRLSLINKMTTFLPYKKSHYQPTLL